jgi:hypothetical protein
MQARPAHGQAAREGLQGVVGPMFTDFSGPYPQQV